MIPRTSMALFLGGLLAGACQPPASETATNACGRGTVEVAGSCVVDLGETPANVLACGEGTELVSGKCELTRERRGAECGAGTRLVDRQCVAMDAPGEPADPGEIRSGSTHTRTCGEGTQEQDGVCVRDDSDLVPCGDGALEIDGACVSPGLSCGAGTHDQRGECVRDEAPLFCGPGTTVEDGVCLPESPITCGPGTLEEDGECLPAVRSMECGPGTEEKEGHCMPDDATVVCGEGTKQEGELCVADEDWAPCAPGTVAVDGVCERDESEPLAHSYELRIPVDAIPADGLSHIPLIAYGRNANGEPSEAAVVVWADRNDAGTLRPGLTTLEQAGRRFWFVPCHAREEGCAGPVQFHMALATDPEHIVASTPVIDVSARPAISSMAPCMQGGNTFFITGHPDHPAVRRTRFLERAAYDPSTLQAEGGGFSFFVYPDDQDDGAEYLVTVDSSEVGAHLNGEIVTRLDGRLCTGGKYQIHSIDVDWQGDGQGHIVGLEASFRAECLDPGLNPYPTLVGCVRIDPAANAAMDGGPQL